MKKIALLLSLLAVAAFGALACGGEDEEEGAGTGAATTETGDSEAGGATLALSADPGGAFAYTETAATVAAGDVTVEFDNPASVEHDVVIEDTEGSEIARTEIIREASTSTTAQLSPGEYTYYCSVAGHREGGMEGSLTVE